jgi:hypothetical protein
MNRLRNGPIILDPGELLLAVAGGAATIECEDDARTALTLVGRNAAPQVLYELHIDLGVIDHGWLPGLICDAWSAAEWPMRVLYRVKWRQLWADCGGFVVNGVLAPRPSSPVRLFRGADHRHRHGWSWTPDRSVAQWFADRVVHATPGLVWTALVPPEAMLVTITDHRPGEPEVVVGGPGLAGRALGRV